VFSLVCPKCQTELQVPNSLAGCMVRCNECEAVTRAPELENDAPGESSYPVPLPPGRSPTGNKDVQDYVKELEKKAQEEAERKPYHRGEKPVDLIGGIALTIGGFFLASLTLKGTFGSGLIATLIFGTTSLLMLFGGLVCLLIWGVIGRW
jgi:hypothetical protein